MASEIITPKILEISTVHGLCNASCVMCPIEEMPVKVIMSNEKFRQVLDKIKDHIHEMVMVSFVGMGEPLLDKGLEEKIKMAKAFGFKRARVITNASALTDKRARKLLDAGMDLVIVSVDSIDPATYESIRVNLSFDQVINNIKNFVKLRNEGNYDAEIHVRMIVVDRNKGEVEEYINYWKPIVDDKKGDLVLSFPEHNWPQADPRGELGQKLYPKTTECSYLSDRLTVQATGAIQLCCVDNNADFFDLGNVFDADPIRVYNGEIFSKCRELMVKGEIDKIDPCKYCNVPVKREVREILDGKSK